MSSVIYRQSFPDLPELRAAIAARRASGAGWPTVVIETTTQATERQKIDGPLSLFIVKHGTAEVSCGNFKGQVSPLHAILTHGHEPYSLVYEGRATTQNFHFADDVVNDVVPGPVECKAMVIDAHRRSMIDTAVSTMSTGELLQQQEATLLLLAHLLSWYRKMPTQVSLPVGRNAAERYDVLQRLMRCRELLHYSPHDRVSLDELAAVAYMSKYHFLRSFKHVFGIAPSAYHQHVRMVAATELMRSSDDPLTVIAEHVGYESVGTFAATYRRIMGVTPGSVRAQQTAISKNAYAAASF